MKTISMRSLMAFVGTAAALLLGTFAAVNARAQGQGGSKYAASTITVATTANGDDGLHFSSSGCSLSLSGVAILIDIDGSCWGWNQSANVPRSIFARIAPDKVSFRHDGKNYLITDAAMVKRVRDAFAPLLAIMEKEKSLGDQQHALGDKQRALGDQQRDVKVQVPDMSTDFEKVEADAMRLSANGGTQSDLSDLQSELSDLQSRLSELQSQGRNAQSKLSDQQSGLSGQQSALSEQQSQLSDKAKQTAPGIADKLRDLLNQSVQNGTAKPE